jgi:hypothetical protein
MVEDRGVDRYYVGGFIGTSCGLGERFGEIAVCDGMQDLGCRIGMDAGQEIRYSGELEVGSDEVPWGWRCSDG